MTLTEVLSGSNQVEQEGFHFTYANTEEELIAELEKTWINSVETPTNPLRWNSWISKTAKLACYVTNVRLDGADIVSIQQPSITNDASAGVAVTNSRAIRKAFLNLITTGAPCLFSYQLIRGSRPCLFVWSAQQSQRPVFEGSPAKLSRGRFLKQPMKHAFLDILNSLKVFFAESLGG